MSTTDQNQPAAEEKYSRAEVEKIVEAALAKKEAATAQQTPEATAVAEAPAQPKKKRSRRQDRQPDDELDATRPARRPSCLALSVVAMVMILMILGAVWFLIAAVAQPIMDYAEKLPADFPAQLSFYQLDQAKISVETPETKQRLAELVSNMPEWLLTPFANLLAPDLKTQITAALSNVSSSAAFTAAPANLNELSKALAVSASSTSVTLQWDEINKAKEDLAAYYERELKASGFEVVKSALGSEIDLRFLKDGIAGAMTVADSFLKDGASVMNMTVNY